MSETIEGGQLTHGHRQLTGMIPEQQHLQLQATGMEHATSSWLLISRNAIVAEKDKFNCKQLCGHKPQQMSKGASMPQ